MGFRRIWKYCVNLLLATSIFNLLSFALNLIDWWPTAMAWMTGIPSLWVGLSIVVPFVIALVLLLEAKRLEKSGILFDDAYDMPASKVNKYIVKHLRIPEDQINKLIRGTFDRGELHLMALKVGDSFFTSLTQDNLRGNELRIAYIENDRNLAKLTHSGFDKEGWVQPEISPNGWSLPALYTRIRFIRKEVKQVVLKQKELMNLDK